MFKANTKLLIYSPSKTRPGRFPAAPHNSYSASHLFSLVAFFFSYFYEYTAIPFSRSRKNWNHTYFPLTSWTLAAVPSLPVKYCTGVYVFKCFILASCRNLKLSDAFSSTNSEFALKLKYRESDGHYCPTCQILGCSLKLGGRKGLRLRC